MGCGCAADLEKTTVLAVSPSTPKKKEAVATARALVVPQSVTKTAAKTTVPSVTQRRDRSCSVCRRGQMVLVTVGAQEKLRCPICGKFVNS